jgi:trk system potassium uptake protein TrkA
MKRFAVIGIGKFGFHVTKTLFEGGNEVVAIDQDRNRIQDIEPFCTETMVLDAKQKERLKALGLEDLDAVVVSTGVNTITSILITSYLQEIGVKRILAKAADEDHGNILKKVGATEIIYPEKDMAVKVARGLSTPHILDFLPLTEDYNLIQIAPPRPFIGKSLRALDLRARHNIYVIAVKEIVPENFVLLPPADFIIKDSDILIMLGRSEDIKRIKALE